MKIIDKIKKAEEEKKPFFSFEYFPPKTEKGVQNLFARIDRMAAMEPAFVDVTWGAGGSTSDLTLDICITSQNTLGLDTQMHMTCTNMSVEKIRESLKKAKENGITNILALRGDPPRGQEKWEAVAGGFSHGVDLVRFIRQEFGDHFGICVAGYPEGHIDCESYERDLAHLKAKVDAGADFIITQLFYDVDNFFKFVNDCRALGITCPILPGIMPIHTYAGFKRMTTLCKTIVPAHVTAELEPIQNDDVAVKKFGVRLCADMCRRLLSAGVVPGLHFYTLNLEKSVSKILKGLAMIAENQLVRSLPWRTASTSKRENEDVRPIFWSNRPKSYISRTDSWDDFPNGRWGDSRSPAFGDISNYHGASLVIAQEHLDTRRAMWGAPQALEDVFAVFVRYCQGEIAALPWVDSQLSPESSLIRDSLLHLNRHGFLTINSQPAVNGVKSNDHHVGWGGRGGYVYQKAYVEFFCSPETVARLLETSKKYPYVTYHAVNAKGESHTNTRGTNAVTWGVFPGKEIQQPTVVDGAAFLVWKDEAFALWRQWGLLYDESTASRKVLEQMHDTFYLVNVVDNDYIGGNIFSIFHEILGTAHEAKKAS